MEALAFPLQCEALLQTLREDVLKSSEIEGEVPEKEQMRRSIARRLGQDIGALAPVDREIAGVVEMMLATRPKYDSPLSAERLFDWHAALFPKGRIGLRRINVRTWWDSNPR